MTLLTYFLDLFLKEKQMNSSRIIVSAAGCLLLLIGIGMGFFFVFQYMVPIWGYLESGAFLCIASLLGGILLLLISRPKQQDNPASKLVDTTTDSLKNLHIEEMMTPRLSKIIPFVLLGGFLLSQLSHLQKKK
ncbi:MAG: hypothetical protein ACH349_07655 [Candidatus Rhabdochlamydia sp.]